MSVLLLVIVVVVIGWAALTYNGLVKHKNLVEEGWSGIETQLKRRYNLIPNLVESVKGYAAHERETFDSVTTLRTASEAASSVGDRATSEGQLGAALSRLMAVAEAYPELKASENFSELQQALSEVEDQIQLARRYYNGTVRNLNTMIEQVPSNLIAGMFNFQKAEFFEIDDDKERAVPSVSL